jgi:hypothetical protein
VFSKLVGGVAYTHSVIRSCSASRSAVRFSAESGVWGASPVLAFFICHQTRRERSTRVTWDRSQAAQMATALLEKGVQKLVRGPNSTSSPHAASLREPASARKEVSAVFSGSNVSAISHYTRFQFQTVG